MNSMRRYVGTFVLLLFVGAVRASGACAEDSPLQRLQAFEQRTRWPIRLGMMDRAAQAACARVGQWSAHADRYRCTVVTAALRRTGGTYHHEIELCEARVCVSHLVVTGPMVPSRLEAMLRDLRAQYGSPDEDTSGATGRQIVYSFDATHTIELLESPSHSELRVTLRARAATP